MNPTWPVARKMYRCWLCHRLIRAGTRYRYERIAGWESERSGGDFVFWTYRAHPYCDSAAWQADLFDDPWEGDMWDFRCTVLQEPDAVAEQDEPLVYRALEHYEQRRAAVLGPRHRGRELEDRV